MKITDVHGYALSSPYGNGHVFGQPLGVKSIGIVEVHTDAGLVGFGETYAGVYAPELVTPTTAFLREFLLGANPLEPDQTTQRLTQVPFVGRSGLIKSVAGAINIALWDITGKALRQPVHRLMRDAWRGPVKVYASGGSAQWKPDEIEADIQAALEEGFVNYKMRVGYQSWEHDLERVAAARRTLGHNRELMVDAIMGTIIPPWDAKVALERIRDLQSFGLRWLEEPVSPDDLEGLIAVHCASTIPIASGEALNGADEFQAILRVPAVDILQPDVTYCGGLSAGQAIVDLAEASGVSVALHVWGSAIAFAANAHLACAMPSIAYLELPRVPLQISTEMFVCPPTIRAGELILPDTDGLGVQVTNDMKERYAFVRHSGYRLPATVRA
jgi:L-alanine-DL-glutamate epimerase-like enolase superfamily enzyme